MGHIEDILRKPYGKMCARANFLILTRQFVQPGQPRKIRESVQKDPDKLLDAVVHLTQYFVEEKGEYSSSIWPTLLKFSEASNLKIHKLSPTKDELFYLWSILLSGLPHRNMIVSLINVDEDCIEMLKEKLVSDVSFMQAIPELNREALLSSLNKQMLPITEYPAVLVFTLINYIAYKSKNSEKMSDICEFLETWGITEDSLVVVIRVPFRGEKSEVHFYSRLDIFFNKWYRDFFTSNMQFPDLGTFVSSLYVYHKDYREVSGSLLGKFLHYLLNGYVHGELLDRLITTKTEAFLKEKTYGVLRAKNFFSKITI
ncbi:TPA: hypothetical protein ENX78_19430 [Candidatus Poribacteria bacterium]|nr:hypothetical protein [Candidatus Poribacteria bacterium]